ncbi:MAG: hypothetical protein LBU79_04095 [Planctomycetota bacterium]|jgi:phosphopantothenoylcysteine decarboxylase/phosphopantothenate--cysteine ligase|nr:hypothetical protein [Planctomycetota bacterium]
MVKENTGRRRILITAGPTAEDIDPVRFLTNRSSGRMGMAVAAAALAAGSEPFLILGPTPLNPPEGVPCLRVRSAADMLVAVEERLAVTDALVMTAAVADYTPVEPLPLKLKKSEGDLTLRLKRTPDILLSVGCHPQRPRLLVIGFSLDVELDLVQGRRKLVEKNLDAIVVNSVASFAADHISAVVLTADGGSQDYGRIGKDDLARRLVELIQNAPRKGTP